MDSNIGRARVTEFTRPLGHTFQRVDIYIRINYIYICIYSSIYIIYINIVG